MTNTYRSFVLYAKQSKERFGDLVVEKVHFEELFGGVGRYQALKCLFENPTRQFGARELAEEAQIDPGNASRWLRRWAEAGLLQKTMVLKQPRYSAANNPALEHLKQFFLQDSPLTKWIIARLEELDTPVEAAVIFGSIARGTADADSDVDLLLISNISRLEALAFFKPVSRKAGRPINVLTYSPEDWRRGLEEDNPLVHEIVNSPVIKLKGELHGIKNA